MRCSVLQYAAVCCSVLQCVAVCCSVVAVYSSALQCVAVCCILLCQWLLRVAVNSVRIILKSQLYSHSA